MQSQNPLIADFVKLANSAAGTFAGMTREARDTARERAKEAFGGMDFVTREEFDAVKAMAAKARAASPPDSLPGLLADSACEAAPSAATADSPTSDPATSRHRSSRRM